MGVVCVWVGVDVVWCGLVGVFVCVRVHVSR